MNGRPPLRALLFDLDGTLLDTAADMAGALNDLRLELGLPPLAYALLRGLVSHGAGRLVRAGFPDADDARCAALQLRYLAIYRNRIDRETHLFEGMGAVLQAARARGLPSGIVTNKPAWLTEPLLESLGLRSQFACVVSGDSLEQRKPHPAPLLHAADLAGVSAAQCVYIGDAERDIEAAHAAGMEAVLAAYGYLQPQDDWRTWGADVTVDSPHALLDWLERRTAA